MVIRSKAATPRAGLRWWRLLGGAVRGEAGMSTVEYAIGTVAAAAFAAVLYTVVTGDAVTGALEALVQRALSANL
ncbi:MAG TPA: DUF4244 domain-containing protein [Pseudonocardiaceae bacterium]|jgi:hypothetical protein